MFHSTQAGECKTAKTTLTYCIGPFHIGFKKGLIGEGKDVSSVKCTNKKTTHLLFLRKWPSNLTAKMQL